MEKYEMKQAINHAIGKFGVNCADCGKSWLLGDKERTEEEKKEWLCPNCVSRIRAEEAKVDELEAQAKGDEDYDAGREMEFVQSPKDEPGFYEE
jgi:DNA-directed RNA polymerase subunit RPC12/RpoP